MAVFSKQKEESMHRSMEQRSLLSILKQRMEQLGHDRIYQFWTFYGSGSMGEKAQQLFDKQQAIEQAGFTIYPRVVLRTGWFEDFKRRNGISDMKESGVSPEELQKLVMDSEFSLEEKATISEIAQEFSGVPMAVRSSAEGDSSGTGVYSSEFVFNDRTSEENCSELETAIKKVIASEYSESAVKFRESLGLEAGMAVMIENLFPATHSMITYESYNHEGKEETKTISWFAPLLSGCGFTSTPAGSGYVVLSAGLATQAVGGQGFRLELTEENRTILSLTDSYGEKLRMGAPTGLERSEVLNLRSRKVGGIGVTLQQSEAEQARDVDFAPIYDRLKALESACGKPQYVEFAMNRVNGKNVYAILQISDHNPAPSSSIELPKDPKNVLAESRSVVGEGRVVCNGIFVCPEASFCPGHRVVDELIEYNKSHKGYLLIVDSDYFSSMKFNLVYSDFDNASAVIAPLSFAHGKDSGKLGIRGVAVMHFQGLFRKTDKLFMEVDWDFEEMRRLPGKIGIFCEAGLRPDVKDISVEVIVSEKQKKGIAMLTEDSKEFIDAYLSSRIAYLSDENSRTRIGAAFQIFHYDGDISPALPALAKSLDDEDKEVRQHVMESIGRLAEEGNQEAVDLLGKALSHECELVRQMAIGRLESIVKWGLKYEIACTNLEEWMRTIPDNLNGKNGLFSIGLLLALSERKEEKALATLKRMLSDDRREIRVLTLHYLSKYDLPSGLTAIRKPVEIMAHDSEDAVRKIAETVLEKLDG